MSDAPGTKGHPSDISIDSIPDGPVGWGQQTVNTPQSRLEDVRAAIGELRRSLAGQSPDPDVRPGLERILDRVKEELDRPLPRRERLMGLLEQLRPAVQGNTALVVGVMTLIERVWALPDDVPPQPRPQAQRVPAPDRPAPAADLPVRIYLSQERGHAEVEQAVEDLLARFGFEVFERQEPEVGSWFRRLSARAKEVATSAEAEARLAQLERAAQMRLLHGPQSVIDAAGADAVGRLIVALQHTPNAIIQIGSILLIKVDGVPKVRNLTQTELAYLERNPALFHNPAAAFNTLQDVSGGAHPPTRASVGGTIQAHGH